MAEADKQNNDLDELIESLQELREIKQSWNEFLKRLLKRGQTESGEEDKGKRMEQGWNFLIAESVRRESIRIEERIERLEKLLLVGSAVGMGVLLLLSFREKGRGC